MWPMLPLSRMPWLARNLADAHNTSICPRWRWPTGCVADISRFRRCCAISTTASVLVPCEPQPREWPAIPCSVPILRFHPPRMPPASSIRTSFSTVLSAEWFSPTRLDRDARERFRDRVNTTILSIRSWTSIWWNSASARGDSSSSRWTNWPTIWLLTWLRWPTWRMMMCSGTSRSALSCRHGRPAACSGFWTTRRGRSRWASWWNGWFITTCGARCRYLQICWARKPILWARRNAEGRRICSRICLILSTRHNWRHSVSH